uniref:bifunctional diaminohydroxyphosphoribosylaminopyrimidine deaminase/5-amino-6-(5-phosphoribosylamino)uracil reductase RibD n=1 Tax=Megasphaera sp. TaxID=2023260 RepID=UPI004024DBC7
MEPAEYMKKALELAKTALGYTTPNPAVGCVIVKDGEIVGTGYHHKAGTPHAEVWALREAGERAKGATVYVTLEPCAHYGRTPPCARTLGDKGVGNVVMAMLDPNPLVAGKGAAILRKAGIAVEVGLMSKEAAQLNEVLIKHMMVQQPCIPINLGPSLQGRTASRTGTAQWR